MVRTVLCAVQSLGYSLRAETVPPPDQTLPSVALPPRTSRVALLRPFGGCLPLDAEGDFTDLRIEGEHSIMVADHAAEKSANAGKDDDRERWIGVSIGVLAVLLAICSTGGGNAAKEATMKNLEATNTWAFFQAKNMRRHVLRVEVSDLELRLASEPDLLPEGRAAIQAKIAEYQSQDETLTTGDPAAAPEQREGLDQLFARGKALEAIRDRAMRKDPYFDYAEACLQIAIVLASIALIMRGNVLLIASGALGLTGVLLAINGFTLALVLPWFG